MVDPAPAPTSSEQVPLVAQFQNARARAGTAMLEAAVLHWIPCMPDLALALAGQGSVLHGTSTMDRTKQMLDPTCGGEGPSCGGEGPRQFTG